MGRRRTSKGSDVAQNSLWHVALNLHGIPQSIPAEVKDMLRDEREPRIVRAARAGNLDLVRALVQAAESADDSIVSDSDDVYSNPGQFSEARRFAESRAKDVENDLDDLVAEMFASEDELPEEHSKGETFSQFLDDLVVEIFASDDDSLENHPKGAVRQKPASDDQEDIDELVAELFASEKEVEIPCAVVPEPVDLIAPVPPSKNHKLHGSKQRILTRSASGSMDDLDKLVAELVASDSESDIVEGWVQKSAPEEADIKCEDEVLLQKCAQENDEELIDSFEAYVGFANKLERFLPAATHWDPIRRNKTTDQRRFICLVEWLVQRKICGRKNFKRLVFEVAVGLVKEHEFSIAAIVANLGMKLAPFIVDRLTRASSLGMGFFKASEIMKSMRRDWLLECGVEMQKHDAMNQEGDVEQRIGRIAVAVNAAQRWLEVQPSMGDTRSLEWFGETALIAAARGGHWEIVRFLLRDGLADPTLECCSEEGRFESALGRTEMSKWGLKLQGGPTRQLVIERLIRAALPFWEKGQYGGPEYHPKREVEIKTRRPNNVLELRAAVDSADFNDDDRISLQIENKRRRPPKTKIGKSTTAVVLLSAQVANPTEKDATCQCGDPAAPDCKHLCCENCCPGQCPCRKLGVEKRRRIAELGG